MSYYDGYFAPKPRKAEQIATNRKAAEKLAKKHGGDLQPVHIVGMKIATQWWGKSWNENLERYADYANRLDRGRAYVRNGAVLDLRVVDGTVRAKVKGSQAKPYDVAIRIARLPDPAWARLRAASVHQLDSLTELLAGKFPQALKDQFFAIGDGLFPGPREISFECSCPDFASMCKHVAATLYGVGHRLDSQPTMLFALRQVSVEDLVQRAVGGAAAALVARVGDAAGDDVLADNDLGAVFGIEMGTAGYVGEVGAMDDVDAMGGGGMEHATGCSDRDQVGNADAPISRASRKKPRKLAGISSLAGGSSDLSNAEERSLRTVMLEAAKRAAVAELEAQRQDLMDKIMRHGASLEAESAATGNDRTSATPSAKTSVTPRAKKPGTTIAKPATPSTTSAKSASPPKTTAGGKAGKPSTYAKASKLAPSKKSAKPKNAAKPPAGPLVPADDVELDESTAKAMDAWNRKFNREMAKRGFFPRYPPTPTPRASPPSHAAVPATKPASRSTTKPTSRPGSESFAKPASRPGYPVANVGAKPGETMVDRLMSGLDAVPATFTGDFAVAEIADRFPDWTRLQVQNTVVRAVGEDRLRRAGRGRFARP